MSDGVIAHVNSAESGKLVVASYVSEMSMLVLTYQIVESTSL